MSSEESTAMVVSETASEAPLVHLVARSPAEMQAAQGDLKVWLQGKLSSVEFEIVELNAALNEARENNWSVSALTRQRDKAVGQETFYFKLLTAVEAGYTIIPDFPIDVFAIRVTRKGVRQKSATSIWQHSPDVNVEMADVARVGEGEYKSPEQLVQTGSIEGKNSKGEEETTYFATPVEFGELVFPLQAARPLVMNATAQAMALKVFDQIGICRPVRDPRKGRWASKGDPLIIGQVLGRRESYNQKCVSFIIAWHLNLNEL